ncbi:NADPH-dependent oxidoreductase [Alphaproteobacteria bacterium AO1-B]|nr:NADPH-dependent oxidoreductase [Alphaproteobacteria bacterium AO1-B]
MKLLVFLGSVRQSTPPRPARLGERVAKACAAQLVRAGADVEIIDPLNLEPQTVFKPHFAYAAGRAPEALEALSDKIKGADGYVMVSPEYNHSMSPALADLLNHFGSSSFSFKPSAIATYSAGQWGGARAAVNMRTYLSELGCLPVSAMIHVPKAQDVFDDEGRYLEGVDADKWDGYIDRTLRQLIWWAEAAHQQRQQAVATEAFDKDPSQRNAP